MYSENKQISMRQTYRLLFFDLLGLSSLILPTVLAKENGIYGTLAIVVGMLFSFAYLKYISVRWNHGLEQTSKGSRIVYVMIVLCCVLSAGYVTYVFVDMIQKNLVTGESFWLLAVLLLFLVGYTAWGGIESRARMYEVLFWFLVIPLFILLLLAIKNIEPIHYDLAQAKISVGSIAQGGYQVFLCFELLFLVLFLKPYVKSPKRLEATTDYALITAGGILFIMYVLLVGVFGQRALAYMDFPIITLLSAITIPGGFVKRLDAFMLGIWFFTLFALLNLIVYYAKENLLKACKVNVKEETRKAFLCFGGICISVFLVAILLAYDEKTKQGMWKYFAFVQGPLLVVLPAVCCKKPKKRRKKNKICTCILLIMTVGMLQGLTGCSAIELEERCFPMMTVIDYNEQTSQTGFTDVFPVLRAEADGDAVHNLSSQMFWDDTVEGAKEDYEDAINRKPDYNHLKVIVLSERFIQEPKEYERLLINIMSQENFPRNTYVCVTKNVENFLQVSENLSEDLGTYVEKLLLKQKKTNENEICLLTAGELIDEFYNNQKKLWAPELEVVNTRVVWKDYCAMPQLLQQSLFQKILRFHVVANSDDKKDQKVKLQVRDAVGSYIQTLIASKTNRMEVEKIVWENKGQIQQRAQDVLLENGCNYQASVLLATVHFPQKTYGEFVFPEGDYRALEIKLGESKGHNWWCVLYPSMCFSGSMYEVDDERTKKLLQEELTPQEYEKILKPGTYKVKWKILELFKKRG